MLRAFDADAGDVITYSNTPALNGSVQVDPDTGAFEYIPNPDFSGSDSFSLLVIDSAGAADALQVRLDVAAVPDVPVAGDDSNQVWSGLLLQVGAGQGLLINDYDVDPDDTLTINPHPQDQSGLLLPNGAFETLSTQGARVVVHADGGYIYDATSLENLGQLPLGELVSDSFKYSINDTNTDQIITATVEINIKGNVASVLGSRVIDGDGWKT